MNIGAFGARFKPWRGGAVGPLFIPGAGTTAGPALYARMEQVREAIRMDDQRVWSFEESLWTGEANRYRDLIDQECLMVVPAEPFVLAGRDAIEAVAHTPRWDRVTLSDRKIARPQEGLIVLAYAARAEKRDGGTYAAHCTSTYRRLGHEEWRVVQHQQTPPLIA